MSNGCNECIHDNPDFVDKVCLHCTWSPLSAQPSFFEPKPITNADRIRSMTDEELAEWLDALITHCNDGPCFNCFMQKACLTSVADWLKTEVESNDS